MFVLGGMFRLIRGFWRLIIGLVIGAFIYVWMFFYYKDLWQDIHHKTTQFMDWVMSYPMLAEYSQWYTLLDLDKKLTFALFIMAGRIVWLLIESVFFTFPIWLFWGRAQERLEADLEALREEEGRRAREEALARTNSRRAKTFESRAATHAGAHESANSGEREARQPSGAQNAEGEDAGSSGGHLTGGHMTGGKGVIGEAATMAAGVAGAASSVVGAAGQAMAGEISPRLASLSGRMAKQPGEDIASTPILKVATEGGAANDEDSMPESSAGSAPIAPAAPEIPPLATQASSSATPSPAPSAPEAAPATVSGEKNLAGVDAVMAQVKQAEEKSRQIAAELEARISSGKKAAREMVSDKFSKR
jgi:hypothetical protein